MNLKEKSRAALSAAFRRSNPNVVLDDRGYMSDSRENLLAGVNFDAVQSDILQGDGSELRGIGGRPPKFNAVHSSTALAVNTFGLFKSDPPVHSPATLCLPWSLKGDSFTTLHFERKCQHGVGNGKWPNLDVLLDGKGGTIGIESKCLEHIGKHFADFRPAYDADLTGPRRKTPWFREMKRLVGNPTSYCRLNAAQLVKHALGLEFSFRNRSTLAYIFWEPSNAIEHPLFCEHRAELRRFADAVAGGNPAFVCSSYPELWSWWKASADAPEWLRTHVSRLDERYGCRVD
jgi:hypothetical protein